MADVVVGETAEDVAGAWAPQPDRGERRGLVDDRGPGGQVVGEPLEVRHAVQAAGDHAVAVVGQPHHGEVGAEAALGVEHGRVDHAAVRDVGLGDDDALDGLRRGRRPTTSKIANADRSTIPARSRIARCSALMIGDHQRLSHSCSRGITASPYSPSRASLDAYQNGRSQPTVSKNSARAARARASGRAACRAPGPLLAGVHDAVGLVERLRRAGPHVLAGALVRVEAGDVGVAEVDLGVSVGHPLGDGPSDARALLDPHCCRRPETLHLGRLTEDRGAVRGRESRPLIA